MSATLTPDACWYAMGPDRSLSSDATRLGRLSAAVTASRPAPGRNDLPAVLSLFSAIDKANREAGILIKPVTFDRTLAFLGALPERLSTPDVVVESEREIGLDWDESFRRVVSVTIDDTPRLGFSSLIGDDLQQGRLEFASGAQQIPRALAAVLSQLYPQVSVRGARRRISFINTITVGS